MKNSKRADAFFALMPMCFLLFAFVLVWVVCRNGMYPSGSDTMYHIYRGDFLYRSIQEGNWYPLYNHMWYNGVELYRYWSPFPAYVMAFCQFVAGGDAMDGYLIYVAVIFVSGAFAWLQLGKKRNRPVLGAFLGILWFFIPNNLLALFGEGNLPRSLCMVFLPFFVDAIYQYLQARDRKSFFRIMYYFAIMLMCHLGYACMILCAVVVYLVIYALINGRKKYVLEILIALVLSFGMLGIWIVPALRGGITSMDSSEVMESFFQSIWISLNPLERLESDNGHFYFGLSACCLAIFGILASKKKQIPGFIVAILILLATTTAAFPIVDMLPGSKYLWMLRFISIALCFILYQFIEWHTLKRTWVVLFCMLLALDTIPSLKLVYGYGTGELVEDRMNQEQEDSLIAQAQQITNQRMALLDVSSLGSMGAWLVSGWNEAAPATFGAGWEAAVTGTNISQINRALTQGEYLYVFDRCMELGNDTVLVKLSEMEQVLVPGKGIEALDAAATCVGYELVAENEAYRLYHMEINGNWGTSTDYEAIAIGTQAGTIARGFPAMEEVTRTNLNEFTYEELSKYRLIYLAGFTYDDRAYAEELIVSLSESGVHIVIAADGIPEDRKTHDQSFLGVICNKISFSNGYPELDTINGVLNTDLFPQGYTEWNTVYLEGLDECWGRLFDNGFELPFYGTVKNDNIVMIGLNLTMHYGLTHDPSVGELLSYAMKMSSSQLPKREIVALELVQTAKGMEITSPRQHVNTTLAMHDIFESKEELYESNHLMYVDEGTTTIRYRYPYLVIGCVVSLGSLILTIVYQIAVGKRKKQKNE